MNVVHIRRGQGRHPWYVSLVSSNGQVLSISEGYYSKWNARRAAKRMFPGMPIKEVEA